MIEIFVLFDVLMVLVFLCDFLNCNLLDIKRFEGFVDGNKISKESVFLMKKYVEYLKWIFISLNIL